MTLYRRLFLSLPQSLFLSTVDMLRWWPDTILAAGTAKLLYLFNDFALDTDRRELRRGPTLVLMAPQVFDLLEYLIRNRERVGQQGRFVRFDLGRTNRVRISAEYSHQRCPMRD
jgi:hypothetical protein